MKFYENWKIEIVNRLNVVLFTFLASRFDEKEAKNWKIVEIPVSTTDNQILEIYFFCKCQGLRGTLNERDSMSKPPKYPKGPGLLNTNLEPETLWEKAHFSYKIHE